MAFALETFPGRRKFKCPQKRVGLLECGAASVNFMHEILNAVNPVLAQVLVNYVIVLQADTLLRAGLTNLG